ncbi:CHAT domain-containing protein [Streptomyces sp. NPDC005373]|uniref:CHAT domain-containing protein n=1 Tax=Streptomyces sp. NPDC005373 TaxID=3156879 RepID=UPI0033A4ED68
MNLRDKLRELRGRRDAHRSDAPLLGRAAAACVQRFQETGDIATIQRAVTLARAAIAADPAPANVSAEAGGIPPEYLATLGIALHMQHKATGDVDDLTEALKLIRAAVAALGNDSPDRAGQLVNLASVLHSLHEITPSTEVLEEAIATGREGVATLPDDCPDRDRAMVLSNLGSGLIMRYERGGRVEDIGEAVSFQRAAVALTPVGHPDRPKWLNNLGTALNTLTVYGVGARPPVKEAVAVMRESVAALPDGDPTRPMALTNLVNALFGLFRRTGDMELLREATDVARAAVDVTPTHIPQRAIPLNNLGLVLQNLHAHTGDTEPLLEAITACRDAVAAVPDAHPSRAGYLINLGACLQSLFECSGKPEDIVAAVAVCREAGASLPYGHPARFLQLFRLAHALRAQAITGNGAEALDNAVAVIRNALAVAPVDHPQRALAVVILSSCLRLQSFRDGDPAPLFKAITATREALDAMPGDLPQRTSVLDEHATTLHALHNHTPQAHLLTTEILTCSRPVAEDDSAPIASRLAALRRIAMLAGRADQGEEGREEALAAADAAIALLPQIGLGDLDLSDRGRLLGNASALPSIAAAAALDTGRPGRAVELLEQSRGVLTAESVAAGSADLDRLRAAAPDLAAALEDLRTRRGALDQPTSATFGPPLQPGARAGARRDAQAEWEQLLTQIRSVNGFSAFLKPPGAAELTAQAAEGPVVYVCAAPTRCDALVLTGNPTDPVHVVPLDTFSEMEALHQAITLENAVAAAGDPAVAPAARRAAQREILDVLAWLWDAVTEPVLTALGHTGPPAPGAPWPRLWWCPVGVFSVLPLHAAGHHEDLDDHSSRHTAPRTAPDWVVSSYTTTVRALARARAHRHRAAPAARTAIIAVPEAPGTGPLPGAAAEAALLGKLVPGANILLSPTRTSVLATLPGHPVAHFACHSEPHQADPWRSRLILQDHQTAPLTVADLGAVRLNGGLAFLSACTTSQSHRLADEGLHITGAFQLAGYPHVVGTQWPVADRPAHQLAADFYRRLTHDGTTLPDPARSAEALHHASLHLRSQYPHTPTLWAAHTHTGA